MKCSECNEEKKENLFSKDITKKSGYKYYCKKCETIIILELIHFVLIMLVDLYYMIKNPPIKKKIINRYKNN